MNMIWRLFLVFLICCATSAKSEVVVTSGEHATYSRLVFPASDDVTYKLLSGAREITVTLDGFQEQFDLSRVFDRIPKTRIIAVEQSSESLGSKLVIKLACNCLGLAYKLNQYLVIDVIDNDDSRFAVLSDEIETEEVTSEARADTQKPVPRKPTDPNTELNKRTFGTNNDAMHDPRLDKTITKAKKSPQKNTKENGEFEKAKNSLIRQLETAAEQGLVDFTRETNTPETQNQNQDPLRESIVKELSKTQPEEFLDSIRIKKPKETESREQVVEAEDTPDERNCFPGTRLDPENWADDRTFNNQLSELRSNLLGEFDQPSPSELEKLIKFYLFFGLTIEADQLLESFETDFPDRKLLTQISNILGGRAISKPNFFGDTNCDSRAGLWSALNGSPLSIEGSLAEDSILSAYGELPTPLKDIVANRLVDQLIDNDRVEMAGKILEINKRNAKKKGHEIKFLEARILAKNGDKNEASEIFKELISNNAENYQKAIIELAKNFIEDRSFPIGFIQDLENASLQNRDTEDGIELFRLLTISETLDGDPATSFGRLRTTGPKILKSLELYQSLVRENFIKLLQTEIKPSLLAKTVLDNFDILDDSDSSTSLKMDIATELLETGLPNVTLDLLEQLPRSDRSRVMSAQALLMNGLENEARSEIGTLNTPESRLILAKIKLRQGDVSGALKNINQTVAPILYERLRKSVSRDQSNNPNLENDTTQTNPKASKVPSKLGQIKNILQNSKKMRLSATEAIR